MPSRRRCVHVTINSPLFLITRREAALEMERTRDQRSSENTVVGVGVIKRHNYICEQEAK